MHHSGEHPLQGREKMTYTDRGGGVTTPDGEMPKELALAPFRRSLTIRQKEKIPRKKQTSSQNPKGGKFEIGVEKK